MHAAAHPAARFLQGCSLKGHTVSRWCREQRARRVGEVAAFTVCTVTDSLTKLRDGQAILDEHFSTVFDVEDESSIAFVKEMLELYIDDACNAVRVLTCALEGTACVWQDCAGDTCQDADGDRAKVPLLGDLDGLVHQLKGGSSSLGAAKVALACGKLRDAVKSGSEESMRAAAREVCSTYRETEAVMAQLLRTMEDRQSESSSGSEE